MRTALLEPFARTEKRPLRFLITFSDALMRSGKPGARHRELLGPAASAKKNEGMTQTVRARGPLRGRENQDQKATEILLAAQTERMFAEQAAEMIS